MSGDAELGLMQKMVTVTANDASPQMLPSIRRGPFATPTEEEFIEYLIKRNPLDKSKPEFETHSLDHVLSFQRRVHHMKAKFMVRNHLTPLGILHDWWDRTEAQNRAALHSHILAWFRRRRSIAPPLPAREHKSPGNEQKQRPRTQKVDEFPPNEYREDNMYHHAEVARVVTEIVRPHVPDPSEGGLT